MKNYHGIIIDVSQKDQAIFESLDILGSKKAGNWLLYKIEVEAKSIDKTIKNLQKHMLKGYYFHLYRDKELIVVFKEKVFKVKTDKSTWNEILKYGKALKIPEKQLDFTPFKVEDETY